MKYVIALILLIVGISIIEDGGINGSILQLRKPPVYDTVQLGPLDMRVCVSNCEGR
jgi:hypothetical protein